MAKKLSKKEAIKAKKKKTMPSPEPSKTQGYVDEHGHYRPAHEKEPPPGWEGQAPALPQFRIEFLERGICTHGSDGAGYYMNNDIARLLMERRRLLSDVEELKRRIRRLKKKKRSE